MLTYWTSTVNQLNDWLTDLLRYLDSQGTQGTRALEGHLGTRALKALGLSGTRKALGHLATQALEHLGTRGTLFSRLKENLSRNKLKPDINATEWFLK